MIFAFPENLKRIDSKPLLFRTNQLPKPQIAKLPENKEIDKINKEGSSLYL